MIIMTLQSLNLVQYVHTLCAKRSCQSESECLQWLMIIVRMVNFEDNLDSLHLHLGQFLGGEPAVLQIKAVHDTVVKYVRILHGIMMQKFFVWMCEHQGEGAITIIQHGQKAQYKVMPP